MLCGVKRLGARLCGIPDGVAAKLQRLLWMYGMADPEPPRAVQEVPDEDDEEDRDEIDIGKESLPRQPQARRVRRLVRGHEHACNNAVIQRVNIVHKRR